MKDYNHLFQPGIEAVPFITRKSFRCACIPRSISNEITIVTKNEIQYRLRDNNLLRGNWAAASKLEETGGNV